MRIKMEYEVIVDYLEKKASDMSAMAVLARDNRDTVKYIQYREKELEALKQVIELHTSGECEIEIIS